VLPAAVEQEKCDEEIREATRALELPASCELSIVRGVFWAIFLGDCGIEERGHRASFLSYSQP
jgi:hypothetical protein